MRKIVWLFVILFIAICAVSLAGFLFPPVHATISGFLSAALGTVWTTITSAWASLGVFMGSQGHYFLVWTLGVAAFTFVTAASLHALWNKHAPKALGGQKTSTGSTLPFTPQTAPALPESAPTKAQEPLKPEQ